MPKRHQVRLGMMALRSVRWVLGISVYYSCKVSSPAFAQALDFRLQEQALQGLVWMALGVSALAAALCVALENLKATCQMCTHHARVHTHTHTEPSPPKSSSSTS